MNMYSMLAGCVLSMFAAGAVAMESHRHPVQDIPAHEKFYSNWYKPDEPTVSCCGGSDCYPTEIQLLNGRIYARRREDGVWLLVPEEKVERNRDNPDGRNHLCAPSPTNSVSYPNPVICFSLGWAF